MGRWLHRSRAVLPLLLLIPSSLLVAACGPEDPADPAPEIVSFEARPERLEGPGDVTIAWATAKASSLELRRGQEAVDLEGQDPAEGSIVLRLDETTTLTLVARSGSRSTSARLEVEVGSLRSPHIAELEAPELVEADTGGEAEVEIAWAGVEGAETLRLVITGQAPLDLDAAAGEGRVAVSIAEDTTFTLVAINAADEVRRSVTTRLVPLPVIEIFTAERGLIGLGESTVVHWSTHGAAHVELWQDEVQLEDLGPASGSHEVTPFSTSDLELRAVNELGTTTRATLVIEVGAPAFISQALSAEAFWLGETVVLSWETVGGSSLDITLESSGEALCVVESYADIERSSCEWQPEEVGISIVSLAVSNLSGSDSRTLEVYVGDGPLITEFRAEREAITAEEDLEVSWSVRDDPAGNPPLVRIEDPRGTTRDDVGAEGSLAFRFTEPGTYELRLEATSEDPRSELNAATLSIEVHSRPRVEFSATPTLFDDLEHEEVVLSWTTDDAVSVVLYRIVDEVPEQVFEASGGGVAAGSYAFTPREERTYRLVATNSIGGQRIEDLVIEVAPTEVLDFTATPSAFAQGQEVLLRWTARMADEVRLDIATKDYLLEETDAPFLDLPSRGEARLPMTSACGAILTLGCAEIVFPDGFRFPFGDQLHFAVRIHTPGYLSFPDGDAPAPSVPENESFPTPPSNQRISLAPFWDSLSWDLVRHPTGNVYAALLEEEGARIFVIQWKDVGYAAHPAASFDFQVVLREDGSFDYRYGAHDDGGSAIGGAVLEGSSATIGFQLPDQSDHGQLLFNGAGSLNGSRTHRTFSFKPLPPLPPVGELVVRPLGPQSDFSVTLTAVRGERRHSRSVDLSVARRPILILTSEASRLAAKDEEFSIGWRTLNVESLEVIDASGSVRCRALAQEQIAEGLCGISEEAAGDYTYTVRATGAHGTQVEETVEVSVFGDFGVLSFTSGAPSVERGANVLLQWQTFAATSISLLADGVEIHRDESEEIVGSFLVESLMAPTEFTLIATNAVGVTDSRRLEVGIWPVSFGLQVSKTSVRPGDEVTISVDARSLEGATPQRVMGVLPLVEVPGPADRFEDISSAEGRIPLFQSQDVFVLELPFAFPYLGKEQRFVSISWNGYVSFNPDAPIYHDNLLLPTGQQGLDVHLAPFWDELNDRGFGEVMVAQTAPDTFVIQWSRMSLRRGSSFSSPHDLNFQIVLRSDGSFDFRYGTMGTQPNPAPSGCFPNDCSNEVNGSAATTGYQAIGAERGHTLHFGGTEPSLGNFPFDGGLANRTFRYQVIEGSGSFTFRPALGETYSFCTTTGGETVCRDVEIEAPFGFTSLVVSDEELGADETTTISWSSVGGRRLRILDGDTVVHSTEVFSEVDLGSFELAPTQSTLYTIELSAGSRAQVVQKLVEVTRLSLTASITQSTGPGAPVTLSWDLSGPAEGVDLHVLAPMEEISNEDYFLYDISNEGLTSLIGTNQSSATALINFEDFTFPYFGVEYGSIRVATTGYLSFASGNAITSNRQFPSNERISRLSTGNVVIAPFWDALNTGQNGRVYAKKLDADRYVIQWTGMSLHVPGGVDPSVAANLNFLVVLHRDGSFEFRYGSMEPPPNPMTSESYCNPTSCEREVMGAAATIGYQIPGGVAGYNVHFGGVSVDPTNPVLAGGLGFRAWRFSPRRSSGPGAATVHPASTTSYKLCAYEAGTTELVCAPSVSAEVEWGIDLFQVNPVATEAGQPVSLSWSVLNVESIRILANGVELLAQSGEELQLMGSTSHTPTGATTYRLEAVSMGRVVAEERLAQLRTFELEIDAPTGPFLPGASIVLDWKLDKTTSTEAVMITPLAEIEVGPDGEDGYVDISQLEGAQELAIAGPDPLKGAATVNIPFDFPYLGTIQRTLQATVDGYISFSHQDGRSSANNWPLPFHDAPRVQLAVFWDDLELRGGESLWSHAPDPDTLIIQWKGFSRKSGTSESLRYDLNFQVVLRSDGSFDYRYGKMAPPPPPFSDPDCRPADCSNEANGSSATIGYQSLDRRHGAMLHIGSIISNIPNWEFPRTEESFRPFLGGLSGRTFRYAPTSTGSARIVVRQSGDQQVCAIVGDFEECKSIYVEAAASVGELMITELMIDPSIGPPGQWFEVRNLGDRTIDLEGFTIRSFGGSHTIDRSLKVAPRDFVTLASSAQVPFTPDYVYGGEVPLARISDRLELLAGFATIGNVSWGESWSVPRDQALSLDPSRHLSGVSESSDFGSWCLAGPTGNPGAIGPWCVDPHYEIDPNSDLPFIDIRETGSRFYPLEGGDFLERLPSPGFTVPFFGEQYSRIWVSTNGWISFSTFAPTAEFETALTDVPRLPGQISRLSGPLFSAFWEPIHTGERGRIYHEVREVDGQKVQIVQWQDVSISVVAVNGDYSSEGSITFQVQIWEDGDMVVAFGEIERPLPVGSPAWFSYLGAYTGIFLESADPQIVSMSHFRHPMELAHRTIRFRPR